jgi:hypothetical protein
MAMLRNVIIFKSSRTFAHIYLKKIHKKFASHKSCIDENSRVTHKLRHTKVASTKIYSSLKSYVTQEPRRTKFASHNSCVTKVASTKIHASHKSYVTQELRRTKVASHLSSVGQHLRHRKFAASLKNGVALQYQCTV